MIHSLTGELSYAHTAAIFKKSKVETGDNGFECDSGVVFSRLDAQIQVNVM